MERSVISKRILLVDDDINVLRSLHAMFVAEGFEVLVADDGRDGLVLACQGQPDLMVLDMLMPSMGGLMLIERLRPFGPYIPTILITAKRSRRLQTYARALGVSEVLEKPFDLRVLLRLVQRLQPRELVDICMVRDRTDLPQDAAGRTFVAGYRTRLGLGVGATRDAALADLARRSGLEWCEFIAQTEFIDHPAE